MNNSLEKEAKKMWRQLYDRKGQSTGEYALVFAIILGAIIAMQTYGRISVYIAILKL